MCWNWFSTPSRLKDSWYGCGQQLHYQIIVMQPTTLSVVRWWPMLSVYWPWFFLLPTFVSLKHSCKSLHSCETVITFPTLMSSSFLSTLTGVLQPRPWATWWAVAITKGLCCVASNLLFKACLPKITVWKLLLSWFATVWPKQWVTAHRPNTIGCWNPIGLIFMHLYTEDCPSHDCSLSDQGMTLASRQLKANVGTWQTWMPSHYCLVGLCSLFCNWRIQLFVLSPHSLSLYLLHFLLKSRVYCKTLCLAFLPCFQQYFNTVRVYPTFYLLTWCQTPFA